LESIEVCRETSSKDRTRFSRLYLPGNTPKLMINAGIYKAHGMILDLEDSVALAKKDEARLLVRNALRQVNFYAAERMVRINQLPFGLDDLAFIVPHNVDVILLPKCETVEHIQQVNQKIEDIKKQAKISPEILIIPIIESALGIENAFAIASAADNIAALAIGLEDYAADIGAERSFGAKESFYARSKLVNACSAALIQPLDSVFSDIDDLEGLQKYAMASKQLGFAGMGCIHPRQIDVVNVSFAPNQREIEDARKIISAFFEAEEKGLAAVSLGSKMIDPPVVKRAQKVVDSAVVLGLLSPDWRIENG
jgi:citrate lyase subunit beta/citryl-CoA lyase